MSFLFASLREANAARQKLWDSANEKLDLTYRSNEMMGEAGEAANVCKKIERERRGLRGSRATVEQLAEELADVVICADLIALAEGIDLERAIVDKFNATSRKVDIPVYMGMHGVTPQDPLGDSDPDESRKHPLGYGRPGQIIRCDIITRGQARAHPERRFVFGDNALRSGFGGQAAALRGEPNAIGVATKWNKYTYPTSYFSDSDPQCRRLVDLDLARVTDALKEGRTVVIPSRGIGTGYAKLDQHAPELARYIRGYFESLEFEEPR